MPHESCSGELIRYSLMGHLDVATTDCRPRFGAQGAARLKRRANARCDDTAVLPTPRRGLGRSKGADATRTAAQQGRGTESSTTRVRLRRVFEGGQPLGVALPEVLERLESFGVLAIIHIRHNEGLGTDPQAVIRET